FHSSLHHPHLHSFPTRRSSDLITFFVFGALIVATGFDHSIPPLVAFVLFALLVARPLAVLVSFLRTGIAAPEKLFMSWFGPKGVDRKSTRLNSSHSQISYAVFC